MCLWIGLEGGKDGGCFRAVIIPAHGDVACVGGEGLLWVAWWEAIERTTPPQPIFGCYRNSCTLALFVIVCFLLGCLGSCEFLCISITHFILAFNPPSALACWHVFPIRGIWPWTSSLKELFQSRGYSLEQFDWLVDCFLLRCVRPNFHASDNVCGGTRFVIDCV